MNRLIAPNDNHEVVACRVCGKEFVRRIAYSGKQLGPGVKRKHAKTCGRKCSSIWRNGESRIQQRRLKKEKAETLL